MIVSRRKRIALFVGVAMFASFVAWLIIGLIPAAPSMVDVFGIEGLRYPAGIAVLGLLLAAYGCWNY
ncbi:MAG: hypothetical protein KJO55_06760 [Gammaproteobacteria bacterium]|nr:hypothetical protein [Gammaproteobacteria bacterium]NND61232.1 hypothetical protein [Gammaproteobacteria bacterium]